MWAAPSMSRATQDEQVPDLQEYGGVYPADSSASVSVAVVSMAVAAFLAVRRRRSAFAAPLSVTTRVFRAPGGQVSRDFAGTVVLPALRRGTFVIAALDGGRFHGVDRMVDRGCGIGRRRVRHAYSGVWVARCRSARRRDCRRGRRLPAGASARLRDCGWGGATDCAADRETADDPSSAGARGQLRACRKEGGGYRGGNRYSGTHQARRRGVVGASAR